MHRLWPLCAYVCSGFVTPAGYGLTTALVVGFSVGLSFDYDLFERAFTNIWDRLSGKKYFTASGRSSTRSEYAPGPDPGD